jgi:hypothetical protein
MEFSEATRWMAAIVMGDLISGKDEQETAIKFESTLVECGVLSDKILTC